jgi:hypothetical protein
MHEEKNTQCLSQKGRRSQPFLNNSILKYEWIKGHADDLDREPTKCERLNIVADKICDAI